MQPVCPYCKGEMTPVEILKGDFAAVCVGCGARGPLIHGMGDKYALMERAILAAGGEKSDGGRP